MVTFEDGPAKGAILHLSRDPMMLRVVISDKGVIDALDQLDDSARDGERIYVYMMIGEPGFFRACTRGCASKTGVIAKYRLLPGQPCDDRIRTNIEWSKWCELHRETLLKEKAEWDGAFQARSES